ncbi:MAG: hypothetical protein ABL861_10070, partial [Nitrosomonas sp.]
SKAEKQYFYYLNLKIMLLESMFFQKRKNFYLQVNSYVMRCKLRLIFVVNSTHLNSPKMALAIFTGCVNHKAD